MKALEHKIRPILKWHGGKHYVARRIVRLFREHAVYVEPFAGGLSVLLNKRPAAQEVASDLDARLIGLYQILQTRTDEFLRRVDALRYTRETFDAAYRDAAGADPLDAAVSFLVRHRFSRGGLGKTFAWSERLRGGRPGDANGWETFKRELPRIAERLARVEFRRNDALAVIREHDDPDTLSYLDPLYVRGTRSAPDIYCHEMTEEAHGELIETVLSCRGMVVLSGYANQYYDEALAAWERVEYKMPNHSGQGKTKQPRIEVLWLNRQCHTHRTHQALLSWAE
jgi:DNA adenine methylase